MSTSLSFRNLQIADARKALKEIVSIDGVTEGPWSDTALHGRIAGDEDRGAWTEVAAIKTGRTRKGPSPDAIHIAACDPWTMRTIDALVDAQDAQIAELLNALKNCVSELESHVINRNELEGAWWESDFEILLSPYYDAIAKAEGKS